MLIISSFVFVFRTRRNAPQLIIIRTNTRTKHGSVIVLKLSWNSDSVETFSSRFCVLEYDSS